MMVRFHYKGFKGGTFFESTLRAANQLDAEKILLDRGIIVDSIHARGRAKSLSEMELIQFCQSVAALLRTGVPLVDAGDLWTEESRDKGLWQEIFAQVKSGVPLSEAMKQRCPGYLAAMIHIGESTATLEHSLDNGGQYLQERRDVRQSIITAMIYPVVVMVVALVAMVILVLYVMPIFEEMYRKFDTELPVFTRTLIDTLTFFREKGFLILLMIAVIGYLVHKALQKAEYRLAWDTYIYRIPLVGSFVWLYHQNMICQSLGFLLKSGVSLLDGLKILEPLVPNRNLQQRLQHSRENVSKGIPLATAFREQAILSGKNLKMLHLAEEAGSLKESLAHMAHMLQASINRKVKTFATLFEPLLIVGLALAIGFILVGLYLPMFDIVQIME